MDITELCQKLDLTYERQPSLGITENILDGWQEAMGMTFTVMALHQQTFKQLTEIAASPTHPIVRRRLAGKFLREISTRPITAEQQRMIHDAAKEMTKTASLTLTANLLLG